MGFMRENLEDTYNIIELQNKILQAAVYIDEVCVRHGIKYFLMGGSALGAVRHGGFIPWDDDLDIFMTPADYEKFRKAFYEEGDRETYYLQQCSLRDGMVASAKLRLNNTAYIEAATGKRDIHQGIFVDIFLLHNCPSAGITGFVQCLAAKYILIKGQGHKDIKYNGIKGAVVGFFKLFPRDSGIRTALKILYKYDKKETELVCHFMGKAFFKRGIYNSKYFKSALRVPFEKTRLNIPCDTDEYLRDRFGDYMKMPSADSIKQAQHALIWDVNKDFSEYTGNTEYSFKDEKYLV